MGGTVGKMRGPAGMMRGGLGMASGAVGTHVVAALAVVNSVGNVVDAQGGIVAGARGEAGGYFDWLAWLSKTGEFVQLAATNTTLGVVATTAPLTREQAGKVAQMAHDGMGRAIRPAHTMSDGDVVFSLSVPPATEAPLNVSAIGAMAAELLAAAIVDGVRSASGLPGIPSATGV